MYNTVRLDVPLVLLCMSNELDEEWGEVLADVPHLCVMPTLEALSSL